MKFHLIDLEHWKRRERYFHYFHDNPTAFQVTVELDISRVRQSGVKLYPAMLYLLSVVVNAHEEFRTALDDQGRPGIFDETHPSYTIFNPETENFTFLWTDYASDYSLFCERYDTDIEKYGGSDDFPAKLGMPENVFSVSMIPWTTFTSFQLDLKEGHSYLLPIFTMGRFFERNGRVLLPVAIRVHHAVCDGYHVSRFVCELQEKLDNWLLT